MTATTPAPARSRRWTPPRASPIPVVPAAEARTSGSAWLSNPIYYHNRGDSTFVGENSTYGDFFGLDDLFTEHPAVVDGMINIHKI